MLTAQFRVLLIVPDLGLDLAPEVDTFDVYGYSVLHVEGDVTRERIMQRIQKREFDIIHYAGHSGADGIQLSDTKDGKRVIMDAAALVQLARAVKARLVFLNGCTSIDIGQFLIDEHVPYVICTMSGIDNVMARETSQLFYASLAETNDIRTAFDLSKPPIKGKYVILNNGIKELSLAPILAKLDEFSSFIARNDNEHAQIVTNIEANRCERQEQLTEMADIFRRTRIWNIAVMLAGMVGIGLLGLLFSVVSRGPLP